MGGCRGPRRGVPGLGRSCRPGWRGRASRCPSGQGSGRCRGRPMPRSPPPQAGGGSLPIMRMGRASAFCPRNSRKLLPAPPHPHRVHSPASRGGRRRMPGPQAADGRAGSGRGDPGLRLPGSRCSAPSCACAGAVRYANCAGARPAPQSSAAPGVKPYDNWRELRRWRAPRVTGGGGRAAELRGPCPIQGVPGWAVPGRSALICVGGRQFPRSSLLYPNRGRATQPGAATDSRPSASEENFRP